MCTYSFGDYDDLLVFLDRVTVWSQLKGFSGEKKALALASRSEGAAFDNYRRLSVDDKTSFDVIVSSLKREFLRGRADRMQAVTDIRRRKWAVTAESVGRLVMMFNDLLVYLTLVSTWIR